MYLLSDGLYYSVDADGSVILTKTDGKSPTEGGTTLFTHTISADHWCSLVLSVTKHGERPGDWHAWRGHHMGTHDVLEDRRGGY